MADLQIAENQYESFKHDANDVINFKLVREEADVMNNEVFHPGMAHQFFGDNEIVFGYKDLKINIYCLAAKMTTFVSVDYTEKVSQEKDGLIPDDIFKILSEKFQPGFMTNKDDFIAAVAKDANFKPFGTLMHSYEVQSEGTKKEFCIHRTSVNDPGFRDYHERLQPFLLFYVDAASYVDMDDEKWEFYVVYEKYKVYGNTMYAFVGYSTIYKYFAYPGQIRPRISQVLIMPPFQRQGHGAKLIQTFYDACCANPDIKDITVEDPSEGFQRVRDYVDVKNCAELPSFKPDLLHEGFSEDMIHEARHKLHINRKQARRIYEILRLKATDFSNKEQLRQYRLDIKRRLNAPFQKNGRDFEKLSRALNPTELAATMNNLSGEQRMEYLQKTYEECVDEYRHVLERVGASLIVPNNV